MLIKKNPSTSMSTLITHVKITEGYTTMYCKAWLAKQKAIENIYGNWERSFCDLSKLLQAMQQFLPGMVMEKETLPMSPQGG